EEVKNVMIANIDQVLERGEKLETLSSRVDLASAAKEFQFQPSVRSRRMPTSASTSTTAPAATDQAKLKIGGLPSRTYKPLPRPAPAAPGGAPVPSAGPVPSAAPAAVGYSAYSSSLSQATIAPLSPASKFSAISAGKPQVLGRKKSVELEAKRIQAPSDRSDARSGRWGVAAAAAAPKPVAQKQEAKKEEAEEDDDMGFGLAFDEAYDAAESIAPAAEKMLDDMADYGGLPVSESMYDAS